MSITIPLHWQNEEFTLPDVPTPFAFIVFENEGPDTRGPASFGDGINANRWRNQVRVEAFVFTPAGSGFDLAADHAETIAARLRSFRDSDISCFSATVYPLTENSNTQPPGLRRDQEIGSYWCAVAEVLLHFDQIG